MGGLAGEEGKRHGFEGLGGKAANRGGPVAGHGPGADYGPCYPSKAARHAENPQIVSKTSRELLLRYRISLKELSEHAI